MPGYGLIIDDESRAWLLANQLRFDVSHPAFYKIPREVNNFGRLAVKDQGKVGQCSGFSRSSLEELMQLAAAGTYLALSGRYAYICNQRIAGTAGADTGARIADSIRAAQAYGICRDVLCPFDGVYDDRIRDEAYAEGKEHTAQGSHSVLTTPEQMIQFMGAVSPTIQMGIPVGSKFENSTGVLSIQDVIADSRNPLGLHALAVIGYVQPATLRGLNLRPAAEEPHFIGQNSWSERYGFHGFFFMSLSAMRHVCNLAAHHQAEIAGICNQKTFDDIPPKDIDISDIFDIAA